MSTATRAKIQDTYQRLEQLLVDLTNHSNDAECQADELIKKKPTVSTVDKKGSLGEYKAFKGLIGAMLTRLNHYSRQYDETVKDLTNMDTVRMAGLTASSERKTFQEARKNFYDDLQIPVVKLKFNNAITSLQATLNEIEPIIEHLDSTISRRSKSQRNSLRTLGLFASTKHEVPPQKPVQLPTKSEVIRPDEINQFTRPFQEIYNAYNGPPNATAFEQQNYYEQSMPNDLLNQRSVMQGGSAFPRQTRRQVLPTAIQRTIKIIDREFTGNPLEINDFLLWFADTYEGDNAYSSVELGRKLKSLCPKNSKAEKALQGYSDSDYLGMLDQLRDLFGKNTHVRQHLVQQLHDLKSVNEIGLENFIIEIQRLKRLFRYHSLDYGEDALLEAILPKLTPAILGIASQASLQPEFQTVDNLVLALNQTREVLNVKAKGIAPQSKSKSSFKPQFSRTTNAPALIVQNKSNTSNKFRECLFCNSTEHKTWRCHKFDTYEKRKKWFEANKRCLKCLKAHDLSIQCEAKCKQCSHAHHFLLCKKTLNGINLITTVNNLDDEIDQLEQDFVEMELSVNEGIGETDEANSPIEEEEEDDPETDPVACLTTYKNNVSSDSTHFIATCKAQISHPESKKLTEIATILDTGSSNNYILEKTAKALNLPIVGQGQLNVSGYGQKMTRLRTNIVRLYLVARESKQPVHQIEAYVTPSIIGTIQTLVKCSKDLVMIKSIKPELLISNEDTFALLDIDKELIDEQHYTIKLKIGDLIIRRNNNIETASFVANASKPTVQFSNSDRTLTEICKLETPSLETKENFSFLKEQEEDNSTSQHLSNFEKVQPSTKLGAGVNLLNPSSTNGKHKVKCLQNEELIDHPSKNKFTTDKTHMSSNRSKTIWTIIQSTCTAGLAIYLVVCLFLLPVSEAVKVCPVNAPTTVWRFKPAARCDPVWLNSEEVPKPMRIDLYEPNQNEYITDGYKCHNEKWRHHVWQDTGGHIYEKNDELPGSLMSTEECKRMIETKQCIHGTMVEGVHGSFATINSELKKKPPPSKFWSLMGKTTEYDTEECKLTRIKVFSHYGEHYPHSPSANMTTCNYRLGKCQVDLQTVLEWQVNATSLDRFIKVGSYDGAIVGKSWHANNVSLHLDLTGIINYQMGIELERTHQGFLISKHGRYTDIRERAEAVDESLKKEDPNLNDEFDYLNGEERRIYSMLRFVQAEAEHIRIAQRRITCNLINSAANILDSLLKENPQKYAENVLNSTAIKVSAYGDYLKVQFCHEYKKDEIEILPNTDCLKFIPIKVINSTRNWYMNPRTEEIFTTRPQQKTNCERVQIISLHQRPHEYDPTTGHTKRWNPTVQGEISEYIHQEVWDVKPIVPIPFGRTRQWEREYLQAFKEASEVDIHWWKEGISTPEQEWVPDKPIFSWATLLEFYSRLGMPVFVWQFLVTLISTIMLITCAIYLYVKCKTCCCSQQYERDLDQKLNETHKRALDQLKESEREFERRLQERILSCSNIVNSTIQQGSSDSNQPLTSTPIDRPVSSETLDLSNTIESS